ncbi:MAG: leucine-rich repeat protein, partial [Clostridia bacterium]|nr:leucine-rich repeat protein [Clostridia bacterium]
MKKILTTCLLILILIGCLCALFACASDDNQPTTSNYIISFNTNGGSQVKSITLKSGSNLVLPDAPTKEGYVFTGWFLDNECKREVNVALFRAVSNTTIFAGWESVLTYKHYIDVENIENGAVKITSLEEPRASYGTEVIVALIPDDGYQFVDGTLKANGVALEKRDDGAYSFRMPAGPVVIDCEFDLAPLSVSLIGSSQNGTIVLSTESARPGEYVSVQAIPDYGYRLTELYLINTASASEDSKTSILNSGAFYMGALPAYVGAKFEEIDFSTKYQISITANQGGKVDADVESSPAGLFVGVKATAEEGYKLASLVVSGDGWMNVIKSDANGFIMPESNVKINAIFKEIGATDTGFNLEINTPENDEIALISPKNQYKEGEKIELSVTADDGYALKNLFVNGVSIIGNSFTMPNGNATVTAEFIKKGYSIGVVAYNCDVILSQASAYENDVVYFEVVEHEGYKTIPNGILLNGKSLNGNSFIMPPSDVEISVTALQAGSLHSITMGEFSGGNVTSELSSATMYTTVQLEITANEGYRLKPNSLKLTYFRQGSMQSSVLYGDSFIMPDVDVTITAEFEKVYSVLGTDDGVVAFYPDKTEIGLGDIVRFDVVAHSDIVTASVTAFANFGSYSEILDASGAFELTSEKLSRAGLNPILSVTKQDYKNINVEKAFTASVQGVAGGKVSIVSSSARIPYGTLVRLNVEEYDGYVLESIYLNTNKGDSYPISDSFIMPDATVTIVPTFIEGSKSGFSLGAQYAKNVDGFRRAGFKVVYFREKYQLLQAYPDLENHPFTNYLVGAIKVDAPVGHDFYVLEVNDVEKVNPVAYFAHEFIARKLGIEKSGIKVLINYNYVILSVGGNPKEDFCVYKNGLTRTGNHVLYERNDGTYGVYAYVGDSEYVEIMAEYNGRSVSYLASGAFDNPQKIKGINLSNLKEIDDFALENTSISYIDIKGVERLGVGVFKGCDNLIGFTAPSYNAYYGVVRGVLFEKTKNSGVATLYRYPSRLTAVDDSYAIPAQTIAIAPYAFEGSSLKVISYGGALASIGDYAFLDSGIRSIKYTSAMAIDGVADFSMGGANKSSVAVIGNGAFMGCAGLRT